MNTTSNSTLTPRFLPHAIVSVRTLVWSAMIGVAITLPLFWLIARIPGTAPSLEIARSRAHRVATFFLDPGPTALRALLIYPVIEEIFYRGLVMQLLRRYLPGGLAVGVTTLWFAVTHFGGGWANVLFAAAMGLLFAGLVVRTRSLFPAIVCHMAANLTGLFVLNPLLIAHGFVAMETFSGVWPIATVALSAGLAALAVGILRSETRGASRALAA